MSLPAYAGPGETIWYYTYRGICALIFTFLIVPIFVIIPLSFNAEPYFTFTPEMLSFDPAGYSLKWYEEFFTDSSWRNAVINSFVIAVCATLISTTLGTIAALGLSQSAMPFRTAVMAMMISPMIVPLIISAAGMYFFYTRIGLGSTHLGVILAHAALGTPFVVITVTATMVGFDRSLIRASNNLGADGVTTFFKVIVPLILPGVISGGLLPSSRLSMRSLWCCSSGRLSSGPFRGRCSLESVRKSDRPSWLLLPFWSASQSAC